jgi:hypothetical protein
MTKMRYRRSVPQERLAARGVVPKPLRREISNVVLYLRVSTDGSVESNISIPNQKSLLKDYCEEKKWKIIHIYIDEGISAATDQRRGLLRCPRSVRI